MPANETVGFHNRIKLLRTDRGLSRKELAEAVDVHVQTIGYIERRQYNLSMALAFRFAEYFGLSLDAVFSPSPFEQLDNAALLEQVS